jgi:hypothetical protein
MLNILQVYETYKSLIQWSGGITAFVLIYNGILQSFITNIMLFFYLTYKSIKMLQSNEDQDPSDMLKLLKRWVCYSCYVISERIFDLSFTVLPFAVLYNISKIFIFMWVTRAEDNIFTFYDMLVIPFFENYEETLDGVQSILEQLIELYKTTISEFIKNNYSHIRSCIFSYIKDLIRENIVKEEDVESFLNDLKKSSTEETQDEEKSDENSNA